MEEILRLAGGGRRPSLDDGSGAEGPWLWRALDFSLKEGERVAVAGASGTGKTLLLRTLAALEPLQEGTLHFQGRSLSEWSIPTYRAAVLYLPQESLIPEGTVEEAIRLPFDFKVHRERAKQFDGGRARALLETLGRGELLSRQTGDLSGGERQVVALVRALLLDPQVLLLDEPTASMDEGLTEGAEALVGKWLQGEGRAVVWTSHRSDQLARTTDRRLEL